MIFHCCQGAFDMRSGVLQKECQNHFFRILIFHIILNQIPLSLSKHYYQLISACPTNAIGVATSACSTNAGGAD